MRLGSVRFAVWTGAVRLRSGQLFEISCVLERFSCFFERFAPVPLILLGSVRAVRAVRAVRSGWFGGVEFGFALTGTLRAARLGSAAIMCSHGINCGQLKDIVTGNVMPSHRRGNLHDIRA